jgi:hypothetical protein
MSGGKGKGGEGKGGKGKGGKGKGGKGKGGKGKSYKSTKSGKGKGGMSGGKGKGGEGKGGKGMGGKGKGGGERYGGEMTNGDGKRGVEGKGTSGATEPVPTASVPTMPYDQTNSPKPIVPVPTTPAPVTPLPPDVQNNVVTCVSVIDENDGKPVDTAWLAFRTRYPDRPFCLLHPPTNVGSPLSIPATFNNDTANVYAAVTRDASDVDPATRSDWFTICNLADSRARGLTNVVLFVDNSGSLKTAAVQNAHDAFQANVVAVGMQVVSAVYNDQEDYINPCFATSLVGI